MAGKFVTKKGECLAGYLSNSVARKVTITLHLLGANRSVEEGAVLYPATLIRATFYPGWRLPEVLTNGKPEKYCCPAQMTSTLSSPCSRTKPSPASVKVSFVCPRQLRDGGRELADFLPVRDAGGRFTANIRQFISERVPCSGSEPVGPNGARIHHHKRFVPRLALIIITLCFVASFTEQAGIMRREVAQPLKSCNFSAICCQVVSICARNRLL